jgi:hypothetical protein
MSSPKVKYGTNVKISVSSEPAMIKTMKMG